MTTQPALRLLISDVDGTLVRTDKTLDETTVTAIARLKAARLPFTLISARPPSGLFWIVDTLDLEGPFGAFNGGTLFKRDGTVIEKHVITRDIAEDAIEMIMAAGITCWVFADGEWLASDDVNPHTPHEVLAASTQPVVTRRFADRLDRCDKIVGVSDDEPLLSGLEADMLLAFGNRTTVARSQRYYVDITATVANKGDGIAFLAQAFGVGLDQVAVIGDQANDLPMFARAAFSVAMGQADEHVRGCAKAVTKGNDDGGVAFAIDTLILPRLAAS